LFEIDSLVVDELLKYPWLLTVRFVVEAFPKVDCPVAVKAVAVVVASVLVPVTFKVPVRDRLGTVRELTVNEEMVVVAKVEVPVTVRSPEREVLPVTNSFPEMVKAVVDALARDVCPETVRVVAVVVARVEAPATDNADDKVVFPVANKGPLTVNAVVEAFASAVWPVT
jgi:hypothetical protein